jgi:hypothetical protein
MAFEDIEALRYVPDRTVPLRDCRAIQASYGMVETFIDDPDPQEEIS